MRTASRRVSRAWGPGGRSLVGLGLAVSLGVVGCANVWGFEPLSEAPDAGRKDAAGTADAARPSDGGFDVSRDGPADAADAACAGCVAGGKCYPGTTDLQCGTGGAACNACLDSQKCFQAACGGIVLFGGLSSGTATTDLADTWAWNGQAWLLQTPKDYPPGGLSAATAAPWAGQALMTGGLSTSTWLWTSLDWSLRTPTDTPMKRFYPGLAPLGGKLFLFGGLVPGGAINDTWQWTGSDWVLLSPKHAPSARYMMAMATLGSAIVLFGGADANGNSLGDTWSYDGKDWTELLPAHAPGPRNDVAAATLNGQLVIFGGGDDTSFSALAETWLFDGKDWSRYAGLGAPPGRWGAAMAAFDGSIVLFGGTDDTGAVYGDTWTWSGCGWTPLDLPADAGPSPRFDVAMTSYP